MSGNMAPSASELAALTRLFSASVFREFAAKGASALFARLIPQTGLRLRKSENVGQAFDAAFDTLSSAGWRDEYVYRSALTEKVLLGTHSLRTASMLNEFRAGSSKADLVILNGTASVYEIKSERDSLSRLPGQLADYLKVFATVNVIASDSHVDRIRSMLPDHVGLLALSRRYRISIVRNAIDCPDRVCPSTIFESLRSAEVIAILQSTGATVPDVPNTERHAVLQEAFGKLKPSLAHAGMVRTLKRTRTLVPLVQLVDKLPRSLHASALSRAIPRNSHRLIIEAMTKPMHVAMTWG